MAGGTTYNSTRQYSLANGGTISGSTSTDIFGDVTVNESYFLINNTLSGSTAA